MIGGGNSAVEEALYLAGLASRVTLIHRRDSLRAERIMQERLFKHPKISILWNTTVEAALATEDRFPALRALKLRDTVGGGHFELPVHGMFVAIGHDPATALFRGQLETDEDGYIVTEKGSARTSVPGVFAAGDVQDRIYRQAVTAAGSGCMAALDAEKWLAHIPDDAPSPAAYDAVDA